MASERVLWVDACRDHGVRLTPPKDFNAGLQWRTNSLRPFVQLAASYFWREGLNPIRFGIQISDETPNGACFLLGAAAQISTPLPLIPDPYALATMGYLDFRKALAKLPAWQERIHKAVWRGATTGLTDMTWEQMQSLERYELCKLSRAHPGLLDTVLRTLCRQPTQLSTAKFEPNFRKEI